MANKIEIIIAAIDRVSKTVKGITGSLKLMDKETVKASKQMGLALAGAGAAVGALGLSMTKAAGSFEQSEIAFTTMLGSAKKAKEFLKDLTDFAKATPFELTGLEETSKKLFAYGIEQKDIMADLESLGNISAGVGMDKLPQLTLAFGQVKAATKLTGMELRQFTEAGVPLLDALATTMGKTVKKIQGMVSDGVIGFDRVRVALQSLSGEGGKFENLMAKQADSLMGKWSNLKDAWEIFLREEGKALLDWGKDLVDMLIGFVNNTMPKVVGAIKSIIHWFSENKIAIAAVSGAISMTLVPAILDLGQKLLTFLAATGPLGLFGAAVGALVYGITKLAEVMGEGGMQGAIEGAMSVIETEANPHLLLMVERINALNEAAIQNVGIMAAMSGSVANAFKIAREESTKLRDAMINLAIPGALFDNLPQEVIDATDDIKDGLQKTSKEVLEQTEIAIGIFAEKIGARFIDMHGAYSAATAAILEESKTRMDEQNAAAEEAQIEFLERQKELADEQIAQFESRWGGFVSTMENVQQQMTNMWVTFRQGVGEAVAYAIVEGKSLSESFKALMKTIAMSVISNLVQMGIERLALMLVYGTANLKELTSRMASLSAQTYAGAFAATASIPIIGPYLAPGVASAALATMLSKSAAAGLAGAGVGASIGALHGGIESVPAESTYLLAKGERVLSPRQNRDLTDFMNGGGGSVVVEQLNVMPNASIDEALTEKPIEFWIDLAKEKILPALNQLGKRNYGTTLEYDPEAI